MIGYIAAHKQGIDQKSSHATLSAAMGAVIHDLKTGERFPKTILDGNVVIWQYDAEPPQEQMDQLEALALASGVMVDGVFDSKG